MKEKSKGPLLRGPLLGVCFKPVRTPSGGACSCQDRVDLSCNPFEFLRQIALPDRKIRPNPPPRRG